MIKSHAEIVDLIEKNSGKPTAHTDLDGYLGTGHYRYTIAAPIMRKLARDWMLRHRDLSQREFQTLLTSLIHGKSFTEKVFAGMLMDAASYEQGTFTPTLFNDWLEYVEGWAEIDAICTGPFTIKQVPENWKSWKPLLHKLSKSDNLNKQRASLVLLCSPVSHHYMEDMAATAFENVNRLKKEKSILITKAISWLLRSMIKHYKTQVKEYVEANAETLPKIAVRETMIKLKTGKKNQKNKS